MCDTSDLIKTSFAKGSTAQTGDSIELKYDSSTLATTDKAENRKSLPRKFLQTKTVNFDRRSPSE